MRVQAMMLGLTHRSVCWDLSGHHSNQMSIINSGSRKLRLLLTFFSYSEMLGRIMSNKVTSAPIVHVHDMHSKYHLLNLRT